MASLVPAYDDDDSDNDGAAPLSDAASAGSRAVRLTSRLGDGDAGEDATSEEAEAGELASAASVHSAGTRRSRIDLDHGGGGGGGGGGGDKGGSSLGAVGIVVMLTRRCTAREGEREAVAGGG